MAAFNIGGVNVIVNLAISQKVCDVILDVCEGIKNVLEWQDVVNIINWLCIASTGIGLVLASRQWLLSI